MTSLQGARSFTQPHLYGLRAASPRQWGRLFILLIVIIWPAGLVVGFPAALSALTVVAIVAAVIGIFRPVVGLFGIAMLCTLDAPMRVFLLRGGLLRWNTVSYILLAVTLMFLPTLLKRRNLHTFILFGFVAVMIVGLSTTPAMSAGLQHTLGILAVFGLLVYFYRTPQLEEALYWLGVVCGTLAVVGTLVLLMQREALLDFNRNAMSYFPLTGVFAICLAATHGRSGAGRQQVLYALAALATLGVFLTGSRGGMLVALGCAVYLTMSLRGAQTRVVTLLVAGILVVAASTLFTDVQQESTARIERLFDKTRSIRSRTSGRSDLARGAWYIFLEHPVSGVGTGGFQVAWMQLGRREGMTRFMRGREFQAHAGWLKVLSENGLPGLLFFGAYVFSFGFAGIRSGRKRALLLGLLTTGVLTLAFATTEFQAKGLWFLAAGATVLLGRAHRVDRIVDDYSAEEVT